jgi:uncharacterized protein (DUF885 family)
MTTNRRDFIVGTSAALAMANLPADAAEMNQDAAAEKVLADLAETLMRDYPESATGLGIDNGARAGLKAHLTDRSAAGQHAIAKRVTQRIAQLKSIDTSKLSEASRIDVEVMRTAHELAAEGFAFPYGDSAVLNLNWSYRNAPYVVAQNTGAFLEIPSLLDENHTVKTREDVDAYLARLEAYAGQINGETDRLHSAAAQKVIAPDFLLDKTLAQLKIARGGKIPEWTLVASIAKRSKGLRDDAAAQAEKICKDKVAPALHKQFVELEAHRERATSDAGAWKLPHGDEYYAWALRASTTTKMSPQEIHDRGQEELRALQSEMGAILKRQGMTQGTVGERMVALYKEPRFRFQETDAERARLIKFLEGRISDVRARLPHAFATLVPGNLEIKRMAPEVEPGAPGAYGGAGTIDGTVPGKFWINLREMKVWTTYNLPTLCYHESIPGHVWQGEYTFKMPLCRSLLAFNAYSEGWALYAEQLANELGVYDDDPFGRLGYLQSIAFRACRLVVDTGLHARRWTREQAIQWFATTNGSSMEEVTGEVDRYCAWPGQACGYKVGHSEINRLRTHAQQALGAKFDLRRYDDAVVKAGGVPMTVLAGAIDSYIAASQA